MCGQSDQTVFYVKIIVSAVQPATILCVKRKKRVAGAIIAFILLYALNINVFCVYRTRLRLGIIISPTAHICHSPYHFTKMIRSGIPTLVRRKEVTLHF